MPHISILVTVYNREAYLAETLKSILDSSYEEFEVIIVDDNSSDGSLEIARQYAAGDNRIRVFLNEKNLGDYANRNKAASFARGKYLKYLDADDLIYKHSLGVMIGAMEQFPEAALALSSNIIDPQKPYPIFYMPEQLYKAHYLGCSPLGVGPSAAIIRRECFEAVGGFSGKQFVGDSELWLKLAARWPVVALPPALVWWRQHEQQQMQLELSKPDVLTKRHQLEVDMLERSQHLSGVQKTQARKYLCHLHARKIWSTALKNRQFGTGWSLFRDSGMSFSDLLMGLRKPGNK
ncbi:glycosyltransferase family 2 protein [Pseudomonadota bacterium]